MVSANGMSKGTGCENERSMVEKSESFNDRDREKEYGKRREKTGTNVAYAQHELRTLRINEGHAVKNEGSRGWYRRGS